MTGNKYLLFLTALMGSLVALANDDAAIYERLQSILPAEQVAKVGQTPISSLREIVVDGSVFYLSLDGRYLFQGDVIDLVSGENLTDLVKNNIRKEMFASVNEIDSINFFDPTQEVKNKVYVFTDIDCGYCRKLHLEIPKLNKAGVAVSYLSFPRSGLKGESHSKAQNVWCSEDRKTALTQAKLGKKIDVLKCDAPIKDQYNLGKAMGLRGTPAVYTENGVYLGAYASAETIVKQLVVLETQ